MKNYLKFTLVSTQNPNESRKKDTNRKRKEKENSEIPKNETKDKK